MIAIKILIYVHATQPSPISVNQLDKHLKCYIQRSAIELNFCKWDDDWRTIQVAGEEGAKCKFMYALALNSWKITRKQSREEKWFSMLSTKAQIISMRLLIRSGAQQGMKLNMLTDERIILYYMWLFFTYTLAELYLPAKKCDKLHKLVANDFVKVKISGIKINPPNMIALFITKRSIYIFICICTYLYIYPCIRISLNAKKR